MMRTAVKGDENYPHSNLDDSLAVTFRSEATKRNRNPSAKAREAGRANTEIIDLDLDNTLNNRPPTTPKMFRIERDGQSTDSS